jgi:glycosyltransferase involved in cell wall biosynthesis
MVNNQLKIAYLSNQISWGGAPKSLLLLIKSLSQQNLKMYLYVTHCSSVEMKNEFEQYVEFVKIVDLPEITSAQTQSLNHNKQKVDQYKINLETTKQFADELNNLKIDILHINNSVFAPIYKTIRTKTKVKIVSHIREWINWNGIHQKQKFIINAISNYSDAIICISDTEAKIFDNHPNVFVMPNPFDFHVLDLINKDKNQIKFTLGLDENHFLVGMVGRSSINKGTLDFLKAFAWLKKIYKNDILNIKFVILGEKIPMSTNIYLLIIRKLLGKSTYSNDLLKVMKKENLFNDVIFLSKRKDVLEIINSFDIAVRPSYSGDPWGRDIIEYMALKKPIVATGSSEFYVKNGETGFLVPPRDYHQLAEKIYWLFKNKTEREKMGQKAYGNILNKTNDEIYRLKVLMVYSTLFSLKK